MHKYPASQRDHAHSFLHSLYELSRDLDRNRSDNDFCRDGGEIVYFLDSNVTIGFVSPARSYHSFKGDFGSLVRPKGNEVKQNAPAQQQENSATALDIRAILLMLSTEYIFSEKIVGKKGGFYITPWHRHEVAYNMLNVHSECMQNMKRDGGKGKSLVQMIRDLEKIAEIASPENEKEYFDLANRIALEASLIPLQLIDRVMSERTFKSDSETWKLAGIKAASMTRPWDGIIDYRAEDKIPGNDVADARSLSFMQWIADHRLNENRRLVFITTDSDLATWYDRWFHEDHVGTGYAPKRYIVRRISQYLPQLNLKNADVFSADDDNEKNGRVFEKIRQIVELIIAPDMIRLLEKKLDRLDAEDFIAYERTNRISTQLKKSIDGILDGLTEIEAKSIYLFGDYLSRRIPKELMEIATSLSDEDASYEIEKYIQNKSNPQNAVAYFADKMSAIDPSIWRRIPQTLNFPIGERRKLFEFIQASVSSKKIDGDSIKNLPPSTIFAVCAGIVYALENEYSPLRIADRYARLCLESCVNDQTDGLDAPVTEARFLCALINRFLLGHADSVEIASRHFKKAVSFLGSIDRSATADPFDEIRFDAEHGATLMFMAAQHYKAGEVMDGNSKIADAKGLLESCRRKKQLYGVEPEPESEIKRHYTHNLAAIRVLESLTTPFDAHQPDDTNDADGSLTAAVKAILKKDKDPSEFLQAELYYFLSLNDKSYLAKAREFTDRFLSDHRPKLTVDRWQIEEMKKRLSVVV